MQDFKKLFASFPKTLFRNLKNKVETLSNEECQCSRIFYFTVRSFEKTRFAFCTLKKWFSLKIDWHSWRLMIAIIFETPEKMTSKSSTERKRKRKGLTQKHKHKKNEEKWELKAWSQIWVTKTSGDGEFSFRSGHRDFYKTRK